MRLPLIVPALLLAAAANAQQADTQPQPNAPAAAADKQICRRTTPATGSHMPGKRECHTAAEWSAMNKGRVIMGTGSAPPQVEMMNVGNQR